MLKVECSERYTCTRKYFRLSICHTDIHHTRSAGFMSEGRAAHPLLSCSNMRKIHCFLAVLITCHISAKTPRWSLSEKTTNLEHAYGCGFVSKSTGCLVQLSYAEKLKKGNINRKCPSKVLGHHKPTEQLQTWTGINSTSRWKCIRAMHVILPKDSLS